MSNEPLITIGITCYNEGDWLLECWESVLKQTDERWQALLVMDGTKHKRTIEIFDELQHPKLKKYRFENNLGPYPVRNKAFELTETPYHFYLDGDDQLPENSIAIVMKTIANHPESDYIYGDYRCFGKFNSVRKYPKTVSIDDLIECQLLPGGSVYKKKTWTDLGGFKNELSGGNADYDFMFSLMETKAKIIHCNEMFYKYHIHNNANVSSSYDQTFHTTCHIIIRNHPSIFSNIFRKHRFLALGYKRAAKANARAGNRETASKLVLSALRYGMWKEKQDWWFWNLAIRGILPPLIYRILQTLWNLSLWNPVKNIKFK